MNPDVLEYIASERLIHDVLLDRSEALVKKIQDDWKNGTKPAPVFFTWPSETIHTDDGKAVSSVFLYPLPLDRNTWTKIMRKMVVRTKAYGLLLLDPGPKELKLIFETMHGTRAWTIPVESHGDVRALGAVQRQDDVENIGLLWRRSKASS